MNIYAIPPLLTGLILTIIGLFVFLKNKTSKLNIIFSLFSLSMVIWLFGYTNMYLSKDSAIALKWARIGFLGIIFIPIFAYHFIISFLNLKRKIVLPIIYLLAIPALLLSQTNYIYSGIKEHFWGYYPTAGKIYIIFLLMFGVLFTKGVLLLFTHLKKETGIKKEQIKYVCLAFGFGTFGIVDYLIKYPIFDIYPFGYICALLFISLIAFVIVRYRLMDIRVALTRAGIFLIVYALVLGIPFWLGYRYQLWMHSTWIMLALATIGPFIFLFFQRRAEKILRKEQLEYQEKLRNTSSTMMLNKDLDKLLKVIVLNVVDIVKVSWAAIYLVDEKECKFILKHHRSKIGEINLPKEFVFDSELVKHLYNSKLPLIGEEIHSQELKVGLAVPCFIDSNMIGFLLLGDKPKGKIYDQSDVNEFTLLANQSALAIENCQFYSQERQRQQYLRLASLDRQMAGLAHELDNPNYALLSSLGSIELALDDFKDIIPPNKMEYMKKKIERARFNSKRISKMITSVREFSRASTGELKPLKFEWIMEGFLNIIEPQFKYNGVAFTQEVPSEVIWLRANKVEIEQVLVNLGTNSVQAINEIWQKGENTPESKKEITFKAHKIDSSILRIDFSDTGSGIKKELLEDIFLDFVTTKGSAEGTGLGLSISRKIIQKHGGKIWAESEGENKGATFHIELPIANDLSEKEKQQAEIEGGGQGKKDMFIQDFPK